MHTRSQERIIIGGVDTHKDTHTSAAIDSTGQLIAVESFSATSDGYAELLAWLQSFGKIGSIGVEGTGSYGVGLTRYLRAAGEKVFEVSRPNRQLRRRRGKSDPVDAEAAARAVLSGQALGTPKSQDGPVEAIRLLRLQRRSAIKARTQTANQLHGVLATAPDSCRQRLYGLTLKALVTAALKFQVKDLGASIENAVRYVLRGLARRWRDLDKEVSQIDQLLGQLIRKTAPSLIARLGVGIEVAGALLVAAGDNPERLEREASFAALCGVSPVDASSGRQHRHRLNRGGNRDANRALWVIAFVRIRCDPRTKTYVERRTQEGLSKLEILRCLKRYIAREIYNLLCSLPNDISTWSPVTNST